MGPVDVVHIVKYICNFKRADTHRLTEGIIIEVFKTSTFYFPMFRRGSVAFNCDGNNVMRIADATHNICNIEHQFWLIG